MAAISATCTGCGLVCEIDVPDDIQTAWECPDFTCSTKNYTAGLTPVEIALGEVEETPGAETVTDIEVGTSGDIAG